MKNIQGKISVIMPAYNEEKRIAGNVNETIRALDSFGCDYEIFIVDDGSTDTTFIKAQDLSDKHERIFVTRNRHNFGKGRALKKAFRFTKGEFIVFLDADLDLHPGQINKLFDIMIENNADLVIGSKRHPESHIIYPWHRKIVSFVYFWIINILFFLPIRDTQTGLKLFKRQVLDKVMPKVLIKRYAYDLEILALAHYYGFKIAECPVDLHYQRIVGRIGFKAIFTTWWDTMAVFYRLYILRYYDRA